MPQKHWWCNTSAPLEIYTKMETRDHILSPWNSHSYPEGSLPMDNFRKDLEFLFEEVICKQNGKVKMERQFMPSENGANNEIVWQMFPTRERKGMLNI